MKAKLMKMEDQKLRNGAFYRHFKFKNTSLLFLLTLAVILFSSCGGSDSKEETNADNDVTTKNVTVTFDTNGGTFVPNNAHLLQSTDYTITSVQTLFLAEAPGIPTATNKAINSAITNDYKANFKGWYTANINGTPWIFGTGAPANGITSDVTIYAQWTLTTKQFDKTTDLKNEIITNKTDPSLIDISKITDMSGLFSGVSTTPTTFANIGNWNVSNVTNMSSMFKDGSAAADLNRWDVGNVTDMSYMFDGNSFFGVGNIKDWSTGSVTNMSYMFRGNQSQQDFDKIKLWKTGSVTNMRGMFENANNMNTDISWDVTKVEDMRSMFKNAVRFNAFNLQTWKPSCKINNKIMDPSPDNYYTDIVKGATVYNLKYTSTPDFSSPNNCTAP